MFNRLIKNNNAAGGGCTDIVDNYDPFGGNGVALYQLNGDATDVSGNYNGTATNVTYGTGVFGQAGVFNGSTSKISHNLQWQTNSSFTLSVWVNPTTTPTSGLKAILLNINNNTDATGAMLYTEGNKIAFIGTTSNGSWTDLGLYLFADSPVGGVWTNYIIVKDGGTLSAYTNGSLTKSVSCSVGGFTASTSQEIAGSAGNPGFASSFWNGSIDQVRIFNTALTPLEVEALYTEELCICDGTVDTLQVLGDTSCIATYQLDGNANDLSGNYSGTPTNVSYGVGEFDLAGVFNGTSSYINLGGSVISANSSFSISHWVKFDNVATTSGDRSIHIGNSDNASGISIFVINSTLYLRIVDSNGNPQDITYSPSNNVWYNLAITYDNSTKQFKGYVDNVLINTLTITGFTPLGNYGSIGSRIGSGGANQFLDGSIDQVRVFNKALSAGEVTTLYNETACTKAACTGTTNTLDILGDSSCIAAYPLDGSPADLSGNYNGVQSGRLTYPQGNFDLAGSFWLNEITLPQGTMPSGNNPRSVSAWIKTTYYASPYQQIVAYGGDGTNLGFYFRTGSLGNPSLGIAFYANDFDVDASSTNLFNGDWHHVVCTIGTTIARLYVDGNQLGGDYNKGTINTTNTEVKISSTNSLISFKGEIDQVRIFNKALSASEVTTLYNETPCN